MQSSPEAFVLFPEATITSTMVTPIVEGQFGQFKSAIFVVDIQAIDVGVQLFVILREFDAASQAWGPSTLLSGSLTTAGTYYVTLAERATVFSAASTQTAGSLPRKWGVSLTTFGVGGVTCSLGVIPIGA